MVESQHAHFDRHCRREKRVNSPSAMQTPPINSTKISSSASEVEIVAVARQQSRLCRWAAQHFAPTTHDQVPSDARPDEGPGQRDNHAIKSVQERQQPTRLLHLTKHQAFSPDRIYKTAYRASAAKRKIPPEYGGTFHFRDIWSRLRRQVGAVERANCSASRPAMRPNVIVSEIELPPRRLAACTRPVGIEAPNEIAPHDVYWIPRQISIEGRSLIGRGMSGRPKSPSFLAAW